MGRMSTGNDAGDVDSLRLSLHRCLRQNGRVVGGGLDAKVEALAYLIATGMVMGAATL